MLSRLSIRQTFKAPVSLYGRSVLLADDGSIDIGGLEDVLWDAGASVLLAANAYQARLVADNHLLSAAVIDTGLGKETIYAISACLDFHAVPCVLVSADLEIRSGVCRPSELLAKLAQFERRPLH